MRMVWSWILIQVIPRRNSPVRTGLLFLRLLRHLQGCRSLYAGFRPMFHQSSLLSSLLTMQPWMSGFFSLPLPGQLRVLPYRMLWPDPPGFLLSLLLFLPAGGGNIQHGAYGDNMEVPILPHIPVYMPESFCNPHLRSDNLSHLQYHENFRVYAFQVPVVRLCIHLRMKIPSCCGIRFWQDLVWCLPRYTPRLPLHPSFFSPAHSSWQAALHTEDSDKYSLRTVRNVDRLTGSRWLTVPVLPEDALLPFLFWSYWQKTLPSVPARHSLRLPICLLPADKCALYLEILRIL